jgi:hypothetical protein
MKTEVGQSRLEWNRPPMKLSGREIIFVIWDGQHYREVEQTPWISLFMLGSLTPKGVQYNEHSGKTITPIAYSCWTYGTV